MKPFVIVSRCGQISIERLEPLNHHSHIHRWLLHPKAWAWGMSDETEAAVHRYLVEIDGDPSQNSWLGLVDGVPMFMVETYDPARVLLVDVLDPNEGDVGMHLLVAPASGESISGMTSEIMRSVVHFCFERLGASRIVVEPDVRHAAIAAKNAEVGFEVLREIDLGSKRAALATLSREHFEAVSNASNGALDESVRHLRPEAMTVAQRRLVAKGIAEFAHERLITPDRVFEGEDGRFILRTSQSTYTFRAASLMLEHLVIDPTSIERRVSGKVTPVDAQQLVLDLSDKLGIPDHLMATYLAEVASTLAGLSYRLDHANRTSAELATEDFQVIESSMIEGHPCFFANGGRIGFGLDEYTTFAPEGVGRTRLVWLGARRESTHLALSHGKNESSLHQVMGEEVVTECRARLSGMGLDPGAYLLIPVHPWQWQHHIATTFAADFGRRDLVFLGEGRDEYKAQQSIRTFANVSAPSRPYVKTALAIQNMGFMRGLSPEYMRVTPAISEWVARLVRSDDTLKAAGFDILSEFAAIGYLGDVYRRASPGSAQTKMIAALWRESAISKIGSDQRLMSMAALLHRDRGGRSLAAALIRASGISPQEWLRSYLVAYLRPLVHCLLKYDLAFMPHGENVILVLDGRGVPQRSLMKDIGEEVAVLSASAVVPESLGRIRQVVDVRERAQAIFTDVFDGVFRHLSADLHTEGVIAEEAFWSEVAAVIDEHREEHPEIGSKLDLRALRFDHSCLNRLQLRDTLSMVDLTDQSSSLIYAGTLDNPIRRDVRDA